MEEEASAKSGLRRPNNGFQIVFGGFDSKDTRHRPIIEWYAINIEVPDPEEAETYTSSEKLSTKKLIPFFAGELIKSSYFEAIGSHLYCVGNYDPNSVNDMRTLICTLDVTSPSDGWKFGPPMTTARDVSFTHTTHTVVLDGKLYVLGGIWIPKRHQYHLMEVFDPILNTWEALPNPPSEIHLSLDSTITAVLESKKQILVALPIRHGYPDSCPEVTFYTYNVTTRCWATLEPPVRKLGDRTYRLSNRVAEAVGNTLYWVFFNDDYLVVRAYDLDKDVWFEGSMNIREELFVKHEYLSYGELDRVPFLHLYDQKFCLLVPSNISKRNWKWKLLEQEIHYLNCFIFEVTPIFEKQIGRAHV